MQQPVKRIVFVVNNYPPVVDGVGDYTFQLANEFYGRGYEVHVVCKENPGIVTTGEKVTVWPIIKDWSLSGLEIAAAKIIELQPNWMLMQYVPYSFNQYGAPTKLPYLLKKVKQNGIKILLTVHEPYIRFRWLPLKTFIVGQLQRRIIKELCRDADCIVTSIDRYKAFIGKYSSKEINIIPVPSNINPILVSAAGQESLKHLIAPVNQKIIATFGIRNHILLVNTVKALLQKRGDIQLLVCGKVKDVAVYDSIKDHTVITGYLKNDEVFKYLKCANVFVLPDEIEHGTEGGTCNKSGSFAAACAAGLPVVGTKGDMNNLLLQKAGDVYLEIAEAKSLAERIIQLLEDGRQGEANYLFWQEYLSVPVIADAYLKLIA